MSARGEPAAPTPHVVVVGDVMVDVLVEVRAPFAHASDTPSRIATSPGGSAANQAVWLVRAGAHATLVAAVGADPFGAAALDALVAEGVDVAGVAWDRRPTGTVVALVEPDGQRSMLTDRGANLALDATMVTAVIDGAAPLDHVHVSGYALLESATRPAGVEALTAAGRLGATRSVDVASAGPLRAMGPAAFLEAVRGGDYLFCNLEEGQVLSGRDAPDDVVGALAGTVGEVVCTLGRAGALIVADGEVHRVATTTADVADTVGAGDGFTGTYLARRLLGEPVPVAADAAAVAAATAVAGRGARRWDARYSRE